MQKCAVFKLKLDLHFSAHERSRQHERARNAQRLCHLNEGMEATGNMQEKKSSRPEV
jgi:hypothetical protein